MFEFVVLLLIVGAIVLLLAPRIRRGRGGLGGPGAQPAQGTLLVTGVAAGPESNGSHNVTITGVINGPTVREHEVYSRMVMNVGASPAIGQLLPVVYSPKNPDKWGFAPTDAPPPPPPPPSATELT
ncbi:hypothetical protein MMAD_17380 [Mycolicibacterium madagascariense]|uniref:Uncharacterized protein n=1 Tax=Mycolicibacterium madagascariense TaxID=212765 RepID=A0A7I7XE50_9MYCO|nr:hypothetical protein [Mycolicibacterium madagascariense]MCV7015150.1 hypothetical protein [Mycolicibacterium madagascariense]BBZ27443.1 hypothetical protein MMAD_17380 [Mycolicibacterium madagascariense]